MQTFGFESLADLSASLSPSQKYGVLKVTAFMSALSGLSFRLFGLDDLAFMALILVLFFELVTGLKRAARQQEEITSMKFSRFIFKVTYYLLLIALTHLMGESFAAHDRQTAALLFKWLHMFFVIQIVLENLVSISENMSVISGKDKSHWITTIQKKVNSLF